MSRIERVAAILVLLDAAVLAVLVGWQAVELIAGHTDTVSSAFALLVLSLLGVAAVAAFGVGILRDQSWGRSGGIVTQLLILAVAGGAATGAYAEPGWAALIALPAGITLVVLLLAVAAAGRRSKAGSAVEPEELP